MAPSDPFSTPRSPFGALQSYLSDLTTPTIRLGVTGLSRAGKTVFITALVRNLLGPRRLPFFSAAAEGRITAAYLAPQPDDDLPRFSYERHVEALTAAEPDWPQSTRWISQLRIVLEVAPQSSWARFLSPEGRVNLDIVDYPGEWLLDLGLMDLSYEQWSATVLARMARADHAEIASGFAARLADTRAAAPFDAVAAEGLAQSFAAYLKAARTKPPGLATLGPGRFLMPGDLEGSPMLTFAPLALDGEPQPQSMHAELSRRFEAYKAKVVQPFFRNHFAKLDRQIVLVDALAALNGGRRSLEDLRDALEAALRAFRPGSTSWLGRMLGDRRIDRVVYAATKADLLPQTSHDRLEAILQVMIDDARTRAEVAGAQSRSIAIAAVRATQETQAKIGSQTLACIKGTPLAGERIGSDVFDGRTPAAVFPGDLPDDPRDALAAAEQDLFTDMSFIRFRPPPLDGRSAVVPKPWPHIRLDKVLEFLLADRLP